MTKRNDFVEFCSELGLKFDVDRYSILSGRTSKEIRIAVIGLVSRGKSTLVNQLVGEALCPVDARGETAALIFLRSGPQSASAFIEGGAEVPISASSTGFRERLPRRVHPTITRAEFSGKLRLPLNMSLVDTPGIDDVATADEKMAYLEKHWVGSGATGALVVMSVPVGMARSDYELVESAKSVFGHNFEIVLKAIDSNIELSDLEDVAVEIEELTGRRPIKLLDKPSAGLWGKGDLQEVEGAIELLVKRSTDVLSRSQAELHEIHSLAAASIASTHINQRKLESAFRRYPGLPVELQRAVSRRLEELAKEARVREAREREEEQARRNQVLDRQAQDLSKLLPRRASDLNLKLHGPAVRDCFGLALEGSSVAAATVRDLMALPHDVRGQFGLNAIKVFQKLPEEKWFSVVGECQLTLPELIHLLKESTSKTEERVLQKIQQSLQSLDQQQTLILLDASKSSRLQAILLERFRQLVVNDFRLSIQRVNGVVEAAALLKQSSRLRSDYQKVLRIPSSSRSSTSASDNYRQTFEKLHRELLVKVRQILDESLQNVRQSAQTVSASEIDVICSKSLPLAKALFEGDPSVGQKYVLLFDAHGGLNSWFRLCEKARFDAAHLAKRSNASARAVYVLSFALWGVSIFSIPALQGGSVAVWLVSLAMWLSTRNRAPKDWSEFFVAPSLDEIVLSLKSSGIQLKGVELEKRDNARKISANRSDSSANRSASVTPQRLRAGASSSQVLMVLGAACVLTSTQLEWVKFSDVGGVLPWASFDIWKFPLTGIVPLALVVASCCLAVFGRRGVFTDTRNFSSDVVLLANVVAMTLVVIRLVSDPVDEAEVLQAIGLSSQRAAGIYLFAVGTACSLGGALLAVIVRLRDQSLKVRKILARLSNIQLTLTVVSLVCVSAVLGRVTFFDSIGLEAGFEEIPVGLSSADVGSDVNSSGAMSATSVQQSDTESIPASVVPTSSSFTSLQASESIASTPTVTPTSDLATRSTTIVTRSTTTVRTTTTVGTTTTVFSPIPPGLTEYVVSRPTDYYFTLSGSSILDFRAYGSEVGMDPMFWLYDSSGRLLGSSDDVVGVDPRISGTASAGSFRLRVGHCCDPGRLWSKAYRVALNVAVSMTPPATMTTSTTRPATTTTSTTRPATTTSTTRPATTTSTTRPASTTSTTRPASTTSTTRPATTTSTTRPATTTSTTRPIVAPPLINYDSLSRASLVLSPDINSNSVYWTVSLSDSQGRLPTTAGAQLCAPGSRPGYGPSCTGATMSRSGSQYSATYVGLFLIGGSSPKGSWYPTVFWPVGMASEYEIAGQSRLQVS